MINNYIKRLHNQLITYIGTCCNSISFKDVIDIKIDYKKESLACIINQLGSRVIKLSDNHSEWNIDNDYVFFYIDKIDNWYSKSGNTGVMKLGLKPFYDNVFCIKHYLMVCADLREENNFYGSLFFKPDNVDEDGYMFLKSVCYSLYKLK